MAEPKYYADDKAILDMMYQMVYGGQPTTSIERSYGGMKEPPKPPTPPDDSIIDEYMKLNRDRDKARAFASMAAIKTPIDLYTMSGLPSNIPLQAIGAGSIFGYPAYEIGKEFNRTESEKNRPVDAQGEAATALRSSVVPPLSAPTEAIVQSAITKRHSDKMKELYEQMTPEQKAKVNAKLREQSVEKMDSAIDSYSGDF